GFEPRDCEEVLRHARLRWPNRWHPQIRLVREPEVWWQHPDDEFRPQRTNRLPQRTRVAPKSALPIGIAQQRSAGAALLHFIGGEIAADDRRNPEDLKELRAHHCNPSILGSGACYYRDLARGVVSHRREGGTLVVPILEVQNRDLPRQRG